MNNPAGSGPVPPMACYRFDADLRVYRCDSATYSHWIKTSASPWTAGLATQTAIWSQIFDDGQHHIA